MDDSEAVVWLRKSTLVAGKVCCPIHVSGSAPPRGTEIGVIRFHNLICGPRTSMLAAQESLSVTNYEKGRKARGRAVSFTAGLIDAETTHLVKTFLFLVHPAIVDRGTLSFAEISLPLIRTSLNPIHVSFCASCMRRPLFSPVFRYHEYVPSSRLCHRSILLLPQTSKLQTHHRYHSLTYHELLTYASSSHLILVAFSSLSLSPQDLPASSIYILRRLPWAVLVW